MLVSFNAFYKISFIYIYIRVLQFQVSWLISSGSGDPLRKTDVRENLQEQKQENIPTVVSYHETAQI